jgi:lipoate-protein ligase B
VTEALLRKGVLRNRWLGRVTYEEAWDLQRAIWEGRTTGRTGDDYLLLLEHPHTYTVGRNGDGSNLTISQEALDSIGSTILTISGFRCPAIFAPKPPRQSIYPFP